MATKKKAAPTKKVDVDSPQEAAMEKKMGKNTPMRKMNK